ncbi:MAG TPA: hypothetical protein VIT68_02760 [Candidatus Gracilibacteria bacterium]
MTEQVLSIALESSQFESLKESDQSSKLMAFLGVLHAYPKDHPMRKLLGDRYIKTGPNDLAAVLSELGSENLNRIVAEQKYTLMADIVGFLSAPGKVEGILEAIGYEGLASLGQDVFQDLCEEYPNRVRGVLAKHELLDTAD